MPSYLLIALDGYIGIRVVGMVSSLRKPSPMELCKGVKLSATKAQEVKGSQFRQGRREYTKDNLRSTLKKTTIGYKSVKIGNQGYSWDPMKTWK